MEQWLGLKNHRGQRQSNTTVLGERHHDQRITLVSCKATIHIPSYDFFTLYLQFSARKHYAFALYVQTTGYEHKDFFHLKVMYVSAYGTHT